MSFIHMKDLKILVFYEPNEGVVDEVDEVFPIEAFIIEWKKYDFRDEHITILNDDNTIPTAVEGFILKIYKPNDDFLDFTICDEILPLIHIMYLNMKYTHSPKQKYYINIKIKSPLFKTGEDDAFIRKHNLSYQEVLEFLEILLKDDKLIS